MILRFSDRKFTKPLYIPGVSFEVQRMEWRIAGGCERAVVVARGPAAQLARLGQLLRCPVVIGNDQGGPVWWGFLFALTLPSPEGRGTGISLTLEEMANRVAVRYRDERPAESVFGGWQYQTGWLQDNPGVNEYGKKERIFNLGQAQTSEASAYAAARLEELRRPGYQAGTSLPASPLGGERGGGERGGSPSGVSGTAVLELRGWFSTLGWLFFAEARGQIGFQGGGASYGLGSAATAQYLAQSFTVGSAGWDTNGIWVKVGKFGNPTGSLVYQLRADSGGAPAGVALATVSRAASSLLSDTSQIPFVISPYSLAASTPYWAVLYNATVDAANYYRISVDEGLPFAGGSLLTWTGAAWAARSPDADMPFLLVGQQTTTSQILSMADPTVGGGQFLTGVFVKDASTVQARLYRSGVNTALQEIEDMLAMGTSSGGRLMAWVSEERVLVVESVPGSSKPEYMLLPGGAIRRRDGGRVAAVGRLPGRWASVAGLDLSAGDAGPAGAVLITWAVWNKGKVRVGWE